jgi:hypothetical protein
MRKQRVARHAAKVFRACDSRRCTLYGFPHDELQIAP